MPAGLLALASSMRTTPGMIGYRVYGPTSRVCATAVSAAGRSANRRRAEDGAAERG
jgi:hypothetical protein